MSESVTPKSHILIRHWSDKISANKGLFGLFLVVCAFVLLQWLVHPARYKESIQQALQQQTGLLLDFEEIEFWLWRPGRLEMKGLSLSDPEHPLVEADSLVLEIRVWPLLRRHVEVEQLAIQSLNINGQWSQWLNIQQHLRAQAKNVEPEPSDHDPSLAIEALTIHQFEVQLDSLNWRQLGHHVQVNNLTLNSEQLMLVEQSRFAPESVTLEANGAASQVVYNGLDVSQLHWQLNMEKARLILQQLGATVFKGNVELGASIDFSDGPELRLQGHFNDLDITLTPEWLDGFLPDTSPGESVEKDASHQTQEPVKKGKKALPFKHVWLDELVVKNMKLVSTLPDLPLSFSRFDGEVSALKLVENFHPLIASTQQDQGSPIHLNLQDMHYQQDEIEFITLQSEVKGHRLTISDLALKGLGADVSLKGEIELKGQYPTQIRSRHIQLALSPLLKHRVPEVLDPQGTLELTASVKLPLLSPQPIADIEGQITLEGRKLLVHSLNLNGIFSGLEQTQKTSLLDVGSVLLTGPLGLVASQVASLGKTGLTAQAGKSTVEHLQGVLSIKAGQVETHQLAMSTDEYRVAVDGGIDLLKQRYAPMNFYILDAIGCATLHQKMDGPLNSPDGIFSDAVSTTVFKPFTNLISGATDMISSCEPVYDGPVKPPRLSPPG